MWQSPMLSGIFFEVNLKAVNVHTPSNIFPQLIF